MRSNAAIEAPDPETLKVEKVLLASEGRDFPVSALTFAGDLAERSGAPVHVFSIARIYGVSFGFPNPGLYPNKHEWDEQRTIVKRAVNYLRGRGLEADAHIIGTRKATKRIVAEAQAEGCDAIVMAAERQRNALVADMMWSQEGHRVRRKAPVPVYLLNEQGERL